MGDINYMNKFLHNYYTFRSVRNGDHDGVFLISVDLSCELRGLITCLYYPAQVSGV